MFIRTPFFLSSSSIVQSSAYPCDPANSITVNLQFNIPISSVCSPSLVISNLTGSTTTSGIVLKSTSPSSFSNLSSVSWTSTSGLLSFRISSVPAVSLDGTLTSLGFTITLSNRAFAQASPSVNVSIGYNGGVTFSWVQPTFPLIQNNPMFIYQPALASVLTAQSSPYPCDVNTIAFEMQSNSPIFVQCKPVFTISGLTGTVLDQTLNADGYLTLSSSATANLVSPALFTRASGIAVLNTSGNINGPGWVSFNITVRNQAQYQSAPALSIALNYLTTGGTLPSTADTRPWNVSSIWAASAKTAGLRNPAVFAWGGDPIDWRKPLYIRTPAFMVQNIGQSNPSASSLNIITTTFAVNIELISRCQPKIVMTNLAGACINGPDVALGSLNGADNLSFTSTGYPTGGGGTWVASNYSLSLNAYVVNNLTSINISSTVFANRNYLIYFSLTNPPQGQNAPSVSAQIIINGANITASPFVQDSITVLPSVGIFSPQPGDAMALQVYSPAFMVRSIRQTNPLPGQLNQFIVTIAANLNLPSNSVITISGFAIDPSVYPNALMTKQLSQTGTLPLSDLPNAVSLRSVVKDAPGVSNGIVGNGYYDAFLGRVVLYVGPGGLLEGVNYTFSFQLTNPQCQVNGISPCIRASQIGSAKGCPICSITRSLMSVDTNSTIGMSPINVNGYVNQQPSIGEAVPLQIRQPIVQAAYIQQSTAYPCDTNTLSVMFMTNVPLLASLGQTLVISGLQGRRGGVGIPMPQPSGTINISSSSSILSPTAYWNASAGSLTASIVSNSIGGLNYNFSFVLTNPASPQDCATGIMLNITGMCFAGMQVSWPLPGYPNYLTGFGNCSSFPASTGVRDPTALWGSAGVLSAGRCPLFVTKASVLLNYVQQTSYFPCDPSNTITVYLILNTPISLCNSSIVISGLNATQTPSNQSFNVQVAYKNLSTNVFGNWSNIGNLTLSAASLTTALPTTSCVPLMISFVIRNQRSPRSIAAPVFVDVQGFPLSGLIGLRSSKFSDLFTPSTTYNFSDPLIVLAAVFTSKVMSQSSPWPGAVNTITTTLSTNFPLWSDCASIVISTMQEACAPPGTLSLFGTDAGAFTATSGNVTVVSAGNWSIIVGTSGWLLRQGKLTLGISGVVPAGSSPCGSVACNPGNRNYTFKFTLNNPSQAQNSPPISIQGDGTAGVPISPVFVDKDLVLVPLVTVGACASWPGLCTLQSGDAAPFRVIGPNFLIANIGQSTPYPSKQNVITVTLIPNILLQMGSSITISNLAGTQTPTGNLSIIQGTNTSGSVSTYFSSSVTLSQIGQGAWDQQANTLTLMVSNPIPAGTQVVFSFQLQNSNCGQQSPPVCVRASYVGPTACNNCSLGQCVSLPRQVMNRDMVTLYSTGAIQNSLYPFTKYSTSALITYGSSSLGDAYPLRTYSPSFVITQIGQSTYFPAKMNTITITLATNVPLVSGTRVTIFNLVGSTTADSASLAVYEQKSSGFASHYSPTAQWSRTNGSLVLSVVNDTTAGTQYIFSFNIQNPTCAQSPPLVSITAQPICLYPQVMCADMTTPFGAGFYNATPGAAQPLLVMAPSFRIFNIWQKNPYPGANNLINLELATNINIPLGTNLTVTGLTGSITNDTSQLTVNFPDQDADSSARAADTSSVLSASGSWTKSSGSLIIQFVAETKANTTYRFAIPLINPICCQPGRNVSLATNLICFASVTALWKSSASLDPSVVSSGEQNETKPLLVRCPLWKGATLSSSSLNPCTNSILSLTLQLNVPVQISNGIYISLTGLIGSLTSSAVLSLGGGVLGQGSWNMSSGQLISPWNGRATSAYETFTSNFTLINPSISSLYSSRTISVTINMCSANSSIPLISGSAQYNNTKFLASQVVQTQPVLLPSAAQFTTYRVGQKTSWPGAANQITVSLQTNMPLFGTDFNCPVSITMSGFTGLCNLGPDGTQIPLLGPDAAQFNSTAHLLMSQKSIVLYLVGNLSKVRVISFSLQNMASPQASPALLVTANGVTFQPQFVTMTPDTNPPSTTGVVGSALGALFNAQPKDVQPLQILAPAFVVESIQQNTAWPGASNTITITFSANLDLQIGSVLVISSLDYLDGSSGAMTGPINLTGISAFNFSSSFLVSSITGQGMWDDNFKTLTMYVASNLTAGSLYTFSFQIKNPLCGQPASPVCIRARGISIGCSSSVVIPRTLMTAASGYNAPLNIVTPSVLIATMVHSTPFPSAFNQLSLTVQINVPLIQSLFSPLITLTGLTGVQTLTNSSLSIIAGSTLILGSWIRESGTLIFAPVNSQANISYTYNFTLQNSPCRQSAPLMSLQISSLCNLQSVIAPLNYSTCNSQAVKPLEVLGGPCSGQVISTALFTQKDIGQSTPYPGCSNTIYINVMSNVPLTAAAKSSITIDFADSLYMGVATSFGDVVLGGSSANKFYGSSSVVGVSIPYSGFNCSCPGLVGTLIFSPAVGDSGSGAAGFYTVTNGIISNISILSGGVGYLKPPLISLNGSVCTNAPNLTAVMSFGTTPAGQGQWNAINNTLTLGILSDLSACTSYSLSFVVQNPTTSSNFAAQAGNLLQDALPVFISASGTVINAIAMNYTSAYLNSLPGVSSSNGDYKPMRVYVPRLLIKQIGQSNPFPGAQINILTVTFSINTLLKKGTKLAINGITGAMGSVASRADIPLWLSSNSSIQVSDQNFVSELNGTVNFATWYDCEKALTFLVNQDLDCLGTIHTFAFKVSNPVAPQPCANVRINITHIPVPSVYGLGLYTQITDMSQGQILGQYNSYGVVFDQDIATVISVPGASKGDACPMKIWPAAFVVKDIGQSSPYPCAVNTITVTIASNVPLPPSIQYVNSVSTIYPSIIISRLSNAIVGDIGTTTIVPSNTTVGPDVVNVSYPSKIINLTASDTFVPGIGWASDNSLFRSGPAPNNGISQAIWTTSNVSNTSSIQLYVSNYSNSQLYFRSQMSAQSGCFDQMMKFRFGFRVYNPQTPQTPAFTVSIQAFGIPIPPSSMQQGRGLNSPMLVTQGVLSGYISQTSSTPCAQNTIVLTLSASIPLLPLCNPAVTVLGLATWFWNSNFSVQEVNTSYIGLIDTSLAGRLVLPIKQQLFLPANQTLSLTFSVRNPQGAVGSSSLPIPQFSGGAYLLAANISRNSQDQTLWPGEVQQPNITKAEIWQSSPFPSTKNLITVTIGTDTNILAYCKPALIISNLAGACLPNGQVILSSVQNNPGPDRFSYVPGGSNGSAAWDQSSSSLTLYIVNDMSKNVFYSFQVQIINPSSPQTSPSVSIQASGVAIAPFAMTRVSGISTVMSLYGASAVESQPLDIRGVSSLWQIGGTVSQSSPIPSASNIITINMTANIPLTVNPQTVILISGFTGAQAVDGVIVIYDAAGRINQVFSGTWNNSAKVLSLSIISSGDTAAGQGYVFAFNVTNPGAYQPSPAISIETSGGVAIQRTLLSSAGNLSAPLYVVDPGFFNLGIKRLDLSAYPGANSATVMQFSSNVDLVPQAASRLTILISNLVGVVQSAGVVNITSVPSNVFTACEALNRSLCLPNSGEWDGSAFALKLNVLTTISRNTAVTVTLQHNNSLISQRAPSVTIELTRNFSGFTTSPVVFPAVPFIDADQQALLIYGSATFVVSTISQSTSVPGATNTIIVTIQPSVPIIGGQGGVTISGILGSSTPDSYLKLYDTGSIYFASTGSWQKNSGTIIVKVVNGQTIPANITTVFRFDLTNPSYAQQSSNQILISASGGIPIAPSPMSGSILPLKVDALSFSQNSIAQSTSVPSLLNTITVTFQSSVVLSKSRQSVITIEGLVGSQTLDSMAFPLTVLNSSLVPFSPFPDVNVSLADNCRWADNQVLITAQFGGANITGTVLVFTSGDCQSRWTTISSFNMATGCCNLSTSSSAAGWLWDDGAPRCASLGKVISFTVLSGGNGYKPGDGASNSTMFILDPLIGGGSGLAGTCIVNSSGSVTGITVLQGGAQYSNNVTVRCPSNCVSTTCPITSSGAGAILQANIKLNQAAILAGSWRRAQGSLTLQVRNQVCLVFLCWLNLPMFTAGFNIVSFF